MSLPDDLQWLREERAHVDLRIAGVAATALFLWPDPEAPELAWQAAVSGQTGIAALGWRIESVYLREVQVVARSGVVSEPIDLTRPTRGPLEVIEATLIAARFGLPCRFDYLASGQPTSDVRPRAGRVITCRSGLVTVERNRIHYSTSGITNFRAEVGAPTPVWDGRNYAIHSRTEGTCPACGSSDLRCLAPHRGRIGFECNVCTPPRPWGSR